MKTHVVVYNEPDVCDLKVGKHFMKKQANTFAQNGVRLIQLWASEVRANPTAAEKLIAYAQGADTSSVVAARKCTLDMNVEWGEAKRFYAANHPQGATAYLHDTVGLRYNGDLVAAMSFSMYGDRRGAASKSLIGASLTRYATSGRVPGGAGKLLSAWRKRNCFTPVVSYSDNRMFSGDMYRLLGFRIAKEGAPDYLVYNPFTDELRHKSAFQRKHLEKWRVKLGRQDIAPYDHTSDPRTEFQMEDAIGLLRVYHAGLLRWELPALEVL